MSERMQDIPVPEPGLVEGFEVVDPADIVGSADSYSAKRWLSSKMQVLDEDGIIAVLAERGIDCDTPFKDLSEKDKDMLLANGLLAQILLCGGGSTIKDADGSWSHSEGGWQITKADKDGWINLYNALCRKWGEEDLLPRKGFRIINF